MQGTAADIIKKAMLAVAQWLQDSAIPARLILQVHDELVLEVADSARTAVVRELPRLMSQAAALRVAAQGGYRHGSQLGRGPLTARVNVRPVGELPGLDRLQFDGWQVATYPPSPPRRVMATGTPNPVAPRPGRPPVLQRPGLFFGPLPGLAL